MITSTVDDPAKQAITWRLFLTKKPTNKVATHMTGKNNPATAMRSSSVAGQLIDMQKLDKTEKIKLNNSVLTICQKLMVYIFLAIIKH
jgi:hypothetical protein